MIFSKNLIIYFFTTILYINLVNQRMKMVVMSNDFWVFYSLLNYFVALISEFL